MAVTLLPRRFTFVSNLLASLMLAGPAVAGMTTPTVAAPTATASVAEQAARAQLKVMTYNLKFASESGAHPWSQRRPLIKQVIRQQNPDIIGTQEGLYGQLNDLAADLPGYAWVGEGREGETLGEYTAIFYKRDSLELIDQGRFWLSSTPEVTGSRSWGNMIPRMTTWALFKNRSTGAEFYHYNTHFDHLIPFARTKSATLMNERIASRKVNAPVIVTGDFNTTQGGAVHTLLASSMQGATPLLDTWETARAREGLMVSTYHGWRGPQGNDKRIDWILSSPDFQCNRSKVVMDQPGGVWPSDHFPVVSELNFTMSGIQPQLANAIPLTATSPAASMQAF